MHTTLHTFKQPIQQLLPWRQMLPNPSQLSKIQQVRKQPSHTLAEQCFLSLEQKHMSIWQRSIFQSKNKVDRLHTNKQRQEGRVPLRGGGISYLCTKVVFFDEWCLLRVWSGRSGTVVCMWCVVVHLALAWGTVVCVVHLASSLVGASLKISKKWNFVRVGLALKKFHLNGHLNGRKKDPSISPNG